MQLVRHSFSELAEAHGDEFRLSTIIVKPFNAENPIYKGKAINTPQDVLNMVHVGNSSQKVGKNYVGVWLVKN